MKKIILVLSLVFFAICYVFPCVILPVSEYKYETEVAGQKIEHSMKFQVNGKVKTKTGELEVEQYYKLKGNDIIISSDKTFDDNDMKLSIKNFHEIGEYKNMIAMYTAIGVLVLDLLLVVMEKKK